MNIPAKAPGAQPERRNATIIMILVSILHGLSLLFLPFALIASVFLYDHEANFALANVMMLGLLGWPVVVIAGLIIGWWKRTYRAAVGAAVAPLVWAIIIGTSVEVINPSFFSAKDFLPTPRVLQVEDRTLAGVTLGDDAEAVLAALGTPEEAFVQGEVTPPAEAPAAMRQPDTGGKFTYPAQGITLYFSDGKVIEIEVDPPWSGKTPRGIGLGDPLTKVRELYTDPTYVGTSWTAGVGNRESWSYYGKGFHLQIAGTVDGKVGSFRMWVE